jgi:hypothetical protein
VTLQLILNLIASAFHHHGALHASVGAVSHHLGWIETKHWIVRVCLRGTKGCGF